MRKNNKTKQKIKKDEQEIGCVDIDIHSGHIEKWSTRSHRLFDILVLYLFKSRLHISSLRNFIYLYFLYLFCSIKYLFNSV